MAGEVLFSVFEIKWPDFTPFFNYYRGTDIQQAFDLGRKESTLHVARFPKKLMSKQVIYFVIFRMIIFYFYKNKSVFLFYNNAYLFLNKYIHKCISSILGGEYANVATDILTSCWHGPLGAPLQRTLCYALEKLITFFRARSALNICIHACTSE